MSEALVLSVSEFVAVFNQTLDYAYPEVTITGELANFRISRGKWVYFDVKDEYSSVKFFGSVYALPGPFEDGLQVEVTGQPRLHNQFGFSVTMRSMRPVGEGSIKKSAALLEAKLRAEGLFDIERKRSLPQYIKRVGLITSAESAAYHDFIKILNARWGGVEIQVRDVQVQGEAAPGQIIAAIEHFAAAPDPVDVVVLIRGGGSPEDLAAFSTEQVTRAVAASRIPTLVAIGHEVDVSLAELAADKHASTPSNAAELLVPDKAHERKVVISMREQLALLLNAQITRKRDSLTQREKQLHDEMKRKFEYERERLARMRQLLAVLNPNSVLERGYAVVSSNGQVVSSVAAAKVGKTLQIRLADGVIEVKVEGVSHEGR